MIIEFPGSQSKNNKPSRVAVVGDMTEAGCHPAEYRFQVPAIEGLPFVVPSSPRADNYVLPSNYWNDAPTDDAHADLERGKRFASYAIHANPWRFLELRRPSFYAQDGGAPIGIDLCQHGPRRAQTTTTRWALQPLDLHTVNGGFFDELCRRTIAALTQV